MVRLTYSKLPGQFIIQLIIDDEDVKMPHLTPNAQNLSLSNQLTYLADLVSAIESAKQSEESIMESLLNGTDEPNSELDLPEDEELDELIEDERGDEDSPFPDEDDSESTDDEDEDLDSDDDEESD